MGLVPLEAPQPVTSARMHKVQQKGTDCELALRRALSQLRLRYRVDMSPVKHIRSRADIVFMRKRVAIYIDGCFWHGCSQHGTVPKTNTKWWGEKIEGNRARDQSIDAALRDAGWTVIRRWAHEPIAHITKEIDAAIASRN